MHTPTDLEISCPACAVAIVVPANKLAEGEIVGCPKCAEEFVLARETTDEGQEWHWTLVDLEEEEGDER